MKLKKEICWKSNIENVLEGQLVIAYLLAKEQLMINNNWWEKKWTKEAQEQFHISVLCNDVFAWGCTDSETITIEDIGTIWQYYSKDPYWGLCIWCIIKRKELPQKPVYDDIMKRGIWDLDTLNLKENYYDKVSKENK